ncbi:immunoglobulin-like domain-containing protein [Listeria booriae]|uniref:DUF5011 domain-containing protein n=1 Tax=Listeria booriae TaxID=1552123 RepID=A0A842F4G6_9LIST|nr:immunoglobulin-like domain-containing protein [Listeria booriae]MBC1574601.1 DUF5011 domain-containing protein [Listeria booriae]MBC2239689.1 DUF5011 domain-containing protein [Listeria booriae]
MNNNIKKTVVGLVAFNVVASTMITTIPTQSKAAEQAPIVNTTLLNSQANLTAKQTSYLAAIGVTSGSAVLSGNNVTLTNNNASGGLMTKEKVNLLHDFKFTSTLGFGGGTADGISFVMQNNASPSVFGGAGDALGLSGLQNAVGIAMRAQTWYAPARQNVSFYTNNQFFDTKNTVGNLTGTAQNVTITWTAATRTLSYTIAGISSSYQVADLTATFGGTKAYIGLVGVTGQGTNVHVANSSKIEFDLGAEPVINATDQSLLTGQPFSPLAGVTATDLEDGDLTSSVKVAASDVDTSKPGVYHVTYAVTDSDGNIVSKTIAVTVANLPAPTITPVTDRSTSITVTGDPASDITLVLPDGTRVTKKADTSGKAVFPVSNLIANQEVKAYQSQYDKPSDMASQIVTAIAAAPPTISPVTSADTKLVVTGEPGAKITITLPDGTDMSKTAGSDGKATFTIDTQEVGDVITATQTGANGKTSAPASITVTAGSIAAPTISGLTTEDTTAKGTGIVGATVTITANSINYTGTVGPDGTYAITIPKQAAGATVTAKQEKGGITSNSVSTKVIDNRTPVAPTVNPVKDSDTTVTGTGTKGDTIKVTTPDGETYTTVVGDDGKWSVTIPAQEAGAKIDATATAPNGNTSPKKEVSVLETPQTGKLTTGDFTIGKDKYIVGTFTGDVKNFRVTIGTNVYTGGSIDTAKGTYTFYALDKATQPGTFKIEALDKYGHVLDTKTANIVKASSDNTPGTGTVTAAGFVIGQDKNVTGTFTGDVKSIKLVYDGTTYSGGTLTNGNYTFYALDKITDKTKSARIDGYDAKGNKIATSAVALSNKNDNGSGVGVGTVTANDFTLSTDSNIIGTYTGDVKSIKVRVGDVTYSGGTLTSGNYTFYARDKISSTTQVVFVDGYDAKGNKIATTAVTVKANGLPATTGTITPNTFNVPADKYLTASYTGDVKSVVVTINGTKYTGGTVADGLVNFYIGSKITSSSDVVSIEAFDAYGRSLQSKAVTVNQSNSQTSGTVTPDTFTTPGDSYLTGSYAGDVKSVIVTINGTDYTGGTVADGKINFWIGSKISKATDVVTIKGVDAAGKTLDTKTVKVEAAKAEVGTIAPAEFSLKTSAIKGTYTGNAKTILVTVNGLALPAGGTVADGNFSYYVGLKTKVTAKSDAVTVTLLDKNGLVMDTKSVTIVD